MGEVEHEQMEGALVVEDIESVAEQKMLEEKLREFEEKFRNLFEGMGFPVGIFVGREGRLLEYNKAFKKWIGYTDEELKDKTFLDFVHPDDHALVLERYRKEYSEEELPLVYEIRAVNKKGKIIPVEISVGPYKKKRRAVGITVILRDITERNKMEEELRDSEEKLRGLYESVPDALAVYVGREAHLLEYNKAFRELIGYSDEELKDKAFLDFVHPDDHAMILEKYRTRYPEEELPLVYEIKMVNKRGEIIPIEISVGTYKKEGRRIGINVVHRDITERKRMEEELMDSEERLRTLYESVPDSLAVYVGREGHLLECNRVFKKWLGYTDEELKAKTFLDFVHPDDHALVLERYRKEYSEDNFPVIFEIRGMNKKGESHPWEISVGPYKKKGRVIGINVMHRDITERKEMEKKLVEYSQHLEEMVEERTWALRKSEEMFRNIYNSSKDAIGFASLDGILLDVNDSFPRLTGYSKEELLTGKKHQDMTPKKYHEYEAKIIKRLLRTGKPAEYEKEYVRKDDSLVPVLVTAFVVKGDDGKPIGFATIIKDITELKKTKDEIEDGNK